MTWGRPGVRIPYRAHMKILSIETSCDDTGITVMEASDTKNPKFKILANFSNSQAKMHAKYGGVYPNLAKNEHIKNLPILFEKAMKEAGLGDQVAKGRPGRQVADLIAVTYGPGLEPSLWTGITFAKELAKKFKIPVIPVNHMEGHIFSVFGKDKGSFSIPKINFPALSLLVSGGHTELVLSKNLFDYEMIGKTLDDAAGEAYDKVARMLGLPYPGGPEISKLAELQRAKEKQSLRGVSQAGGPRGSAPRARGDSDPGKIGFSFALPRPMLKSKNFNFSFSGLKTAVLYLIKKIGKLDKKLSSEIALEFENAVTDVLVYKTLEAQKKYGAKTLIVAGGVACNKHLQRQMKKLADKKIKILFPKKELSGDNAVMIGMAGFMRYAKNKTKKAKISKLKAEGNLVLK